MQKNIWADLLLLVVTFIWGATFVLVQNAIRHFPPFSFLAVRFALAFLVLLPPALGKRPAPSAERRGYALYLAGASIGVFLFAGYAFQTFGLLYTTPAKSGFITGLSIVLVPVTSAVWLKTAIPKSACAGVLIATLGLYALTLGDAFVPNIGDGLTLLGALAFALQIVATGRYAGVFPAAPLAAVQIGTVALLSLVAALAAERTALFDPAPYAERDVWLALFVTAVLATAFAYWVQTNIQRRTSPVHVALIFAMEPVFAALTAWAANGEVPTSRMLAGSTLILGGMLLAELPGSLAQMHALRRRRSDE